MKSLPTTAKIYPLTDSQNTTVFVQDLCVRKTIVQIPAYILVKKAVNFELMRKALAEEIRRNDCLRLTYFKKDHKKWQTFLPELALPEIPFQDFTGKTEEDMLAWLHRDAATPVRYLKGDCWRMRFFRAPDGRDGIYLNITHASMDISAVMMFFRDLLSVYDALEKGTDLPAPLTKYEDIIPIEFAKAADTEKQKKHEEFFKNYFLKDGRTFYAGIDRMRQLNALRKKKKDPNYACIPALDPFHNKTELVKCHISGEEAQAMQSFCSTNGVSMQSLIYMGMRSWLSRNNEYTKDVCVINAIGRRATLAAKNCGGCMVNSIPLRSVFEEDVSFIDALHRITSSNTEAMRHADFSFLALTDLQRKIEDHKSFAPYTFSLVLSMLPYGGYSMPEDWGVQFYGVGTGFFSVPLYTLIVPAFEDGGMDCYYMYRINLATNADLQDFHSGVMATVRAGIADPEITVGKLIREVLK